MTTAITEFSKRVQPDVLGCPKQVVDNAVIDAIIRFYEDTHLMEKGFEHDVVTADITAADNDSVSVNLATYLTTVRPIVLTEFRIDGSKWEAQYIEILNDMDDISEIAIQGVKFFTYPDRTHIKFYDIDAKDQRFYIKQAYAPVTTITTVDDDFYDRWHKHVEAGAKWELMSMPGKDWTDPVGAAHNFGLYTAGTARAKVIKDQGRVKGSTRPKTMRFF